MEKKDCTVVMSESEARDDFTTPGHEVLVAHFPKAYLYLVGLFITTMITYIGALSYFLYDEGKVNSRQDDRIETILETISTHSEKLKEPFGLTDFIRNIEPIQSTAMQTRIELDNTKEQMREQNKDIQMLLNRIIGDLGELKGTMRAIGKSDN